MTNKHYLYIKNISFIKPKIGKGTSVKPKMNISINLGKFSTVV